MKMENYEACVGFDLCETPLSTDAQKIMSALRSGGSVDSENWGESTKTSKMTNKSSVQYSLLSEEERNESLETKNPNSLIGQTPRGSTQLSPQSSITEFIGQLSAGQVQQSMSSLALSSCVIPPCNQEAPVLQKMEPKRKHFLKESRSKGNKESRCLKRKCITCSDSLVETDKHMGLEEDTDETEAPLNSEDSATFEKQLCDIRYLDDLAKVHLMDVLKQAAALVVTLLYKDGSTQLRASQALTSSVKGIVMLLRSHVDSSPLSPLTCDALGEDLADHYIYIQTEHPFLWGQKQEAYSLFVRNVLFQTLRCKCPVICFNAKDFVRTVLKFFGEDGSWKHVAGFVGLDPRVAAWLIDPSDAAPSFEDLVAKYLKSPLQSKQAAYMVTLQEVWWFELLRIKGSSDRGRKLAQGQFGNEKEGSGNHEHAGLSGGCAMPRRGPILELLKVETCDHFRVKKIAGHHMELCQMVARVTRKPRPGNDWRACQNQNVCVNLKILYDLSMDLCSKLKAYGLWQLFCTLELPLIPILAVMENHNIQVNKEEMERTSALLAEFPCFAQCWQAVLWVMSAPVKRLVSKELEQEAHFVAGEQFLITSNNQLREILFGKLKLHLLSQRKHLPRTGMQKQLSTSEAVLNSLQDFHPLPKIILEYRQVHKIKSTFVDGLLACIKKNIQGISKHPIQISKPQNFKDFSQIELRILAHLSGDPELLKLFQESERDDVFSTLTSQWKHIPVERVTHMDREQTKKVVYSVVYGAGKERLAACLGVTVLEATHFLEGFLQKYKKIKDFSQAVIAQCHSAGYVMSIVGRRRPLPRIRAQDQQLRAQAERQAVNFMVQGSAADLCKLAMIRIFAAVASSSTLTARLVAQIHDELLFEVEDAQIPEFAALVRGIMESSQQVQTPELQLKVPLKVNLSVGRSWGHLMPLQEVLDSA